jgi:hypothetical protein
VQNLAINFASFTRNQVTKSKEGGMARGIKKIKIIASTNYPIVTAYEFEHLKTEEIMQEIFRPCTLYLIVQRPLMYIQNLFISTRSIDFEICDDSENENLKCKMRRF